MSTIDYCILDIKLFNFGKRTNIMDVNVVVKIRSSYSDWREIFDNDTENREKYVMTAGQLAAMLMIKLQL